MRLELVAALPEEHRKAAANRQCGRSPIYSTSRIGRRQAVCNAMLPHLPLLVRSDTQIGARYGAAQQDVAGEFVFVKVCIGVIVLDDAIEQTSGTGEAAALVTDRGQKDSAGGCGIPEMLILRAGEGAKILGRFQRNEEAPLLRHLTFDAAGPLRAIGLRQSWRCAAVLPGSGGARNEGLRKPGLKGYRSRDFCCTAPRPALHGGSARRESTCRRVHAPAIR